MRPRSFVFLLVCVIQRREAFSEVWKIVMGKLDKFSSFLGVPLEGLEDEAKDLFCLIEERRLNAVVLGSKSVDCKRLWNELKRLNYGINYERSVGSVNEGGM